MNTGYISFTSIVHSLARHRLAIVGLFILVCVLLAGIFAPVLANNPPDEINPIVRLKTPGWRDPSGNLYPLGTDSLGRDVLARTLYGARISLSVGLVAVLISGVIGVLLGVIAGYFGGAVDDVIMRIADIQLSFPFILLAISILAVLGSGLDKLIITLGISQWMQYARLARAQTIALREYEFVWVLLTMAVIARHCWTSGDAAPARP